MGSDGACERGRVHGLLELPQQRDEPGSTRSVSERARQLGGGFAILEIHRPISVGALPRKPLGSHESAHLEQSSDGGLPCGELLSDGRLTLASVSQPSRSLHPYPGEHGAG